MRNKLAIIVFFGLLILPTVLFFALRGVIDTENHENRNYASFPEISIANLKNIPGGIEDYYIDRVPFKNQFTGLNSMMENRLSRNKSKYEILGPIADSHEDTTEEEYVNISDIHNGEERETLLPTVTEGEEEWLYYTVLSNDAKEDAIAEMFGKYKYSPAELRTIARDYKALSDYLKGEGCDFYFWMIPSKEQIYPEYLPENYRKFYTDDSRGKQLCDYLLENTDVNTVYPIEEIRAAKDVSPMFYKYDTHWTQPGAYVGVKALLNYMGKDMKELSDITINKVEGEFERDLAKFLNLQNEYIGDYLYVVSDYTDSKSEMVEMNYETEIVYDSSVSDSPDQRKVVIIGDSFLYVSDGIMRNYFGDFYLDRDWERAAETIKRVKPDIVVFESNQRFYGRQETFPGEFLRLLKK